MRTRMYFRKGLAIFATGLVAGLLAWQGWDQYRAAQRRLGAVFERVEGGMQVLEVEPGRAVDRAGIEAGDVVVGLGDRPVDSLLELTRVLSELEAGEPVEATILRTGDELRVVLHPGGEVSWGSFALSMLAALAYLALAILAFLQREPDLRADLLGWFSLAVSVELAMPLGIVDPWALAFGAPFLYLLAGVQIGLELHLLSLIPDRPRWLERRAWIVPLYYASGLFAGLVPAVGFVLYLVAPEVVSSALLTEIETAFFSWVFPVWAVVAVGLLLPRALHHPEPRGRQQASLVLVGVAPWALYVLGWTAAEVVGWVPPAWTYDLQNLVLICFPVAVFAAIFRAHLFDLELVVRRSLVYGMLTGALILVFYGVLGAGGAVFSGWIGQGSSVWAISLATLVLGLLFAPLRRFVQRWIERRFFPERRAMRQRLTDLAEDLPGQGRLSRMAEHLSTQLERIFAVSHVAVWIADASGDVLQAAEAGSEEPLPEDDPGLRSLRDARAPQPAHAVLDRSPELSERRSFEDAEVLVPLVRRDQLVGILALGSKEGKSRFPAEEVELLSLFSHHVATVLENARLFESATIESLTGLLRRETILEKAEQELVRARRYGRPLTLGLLDLDHFKDVNDRYGHLAGDHLLRHLAREMASDLRATDLLGRYGGEEFLLLLPETDLEGAAVVAEKLRRRVRELRVPMEDGSETGVTVSIGLASRKAEGDELAPEASRAIRDLLADADRALYLAKRSGRNQVQPSVGSSVTTS